MTDLKNTIGDPMHKSRYGWTLIAFIVAGVFISALMVWQLAGLSPRIWCGLADATSPDNTTACSAVLIKILDVKDHALIALGTILGITVVSVVAIALGLRISAAGPGGTSINVGADTTRVDTDDASVEIPTPPSEDK